MALIGIDGSGKTTQAHRLAEALTAAGHPATYHRNAGGRRWLGRVAHRLGRPDALSLLGRDGMLLVESVLRWLAIAMTLLGGLCTGRVAVMDRYAACQYASLRAHGGHRWERMIRATYRLFPRPQLTFLLTVEPTEAYRRIERRGTDHETLGFLAAADLAYRTLPEYPTFVPVDAALPAEELAREIREHLNAWLTAGNEPTATVPAGAVAPVTELVPLQARP
ncbi:MULTISPECIES: dTMP kinase [unclassified Micromonospora]|uniref:dTMP kinase n=1 Tax=unclassified Micromonospora TaxID=2617518 RepID=UPI0022B64CC5|nr:MULTISPECIES: dTMP kinase [unclassified Micromonospora]MCZ7418728.1 dTMP kinase [Verrucosispora sp. WMMA2121]WBB94400.1 dTMP kinase [Verrucosispora sp. WMMC514]